MLKEKRCEHVKKKKEILNIIQRLAVINLACEATIMLLAPPKSPYQSVVVV